MNQEYMTQEEVFLLEELDELYRELEEYEQRQNDEGIRLIYQEIRDRERTLEEL
jgi:hypothetical protein